MSRVLPYNAKQWEIPLLLDGRKTVTRRVVRRGKSYPEYHGRSKLFGVVDHLNNDYANWYVGFYNDNDVFTGSDGGQHIDALYWKAPCKPGDILYIRETWQYLYELDGNKQIIEGTGKYYYAATDTLPFTAYVDSSGVTHENIPWRPSIHMPKEAARIWLNVKDVRVERLQDITEKQAINEGISRLYDDLSDAEYIGWTKRIGIYPKAKEDWGYKNYLWHGNFGAFGSGNWRSDNWDYQKSSYDSAIGSFSSLWNSNLKKSDLDRYGWDANPWVWVIEFERCGKPENLQEGTE